jgi:hypothetical protein
MLKPDFILSVFAMQCWCLKKSHDYAMLLFVLDICHFICNYLLA